MIMAVIGLLYPFWRYIDYYLNANAIETLPERAAIGLMFLVFALATFLHPYFEKRAAMLFDLGAGIWTLQVFFLLWRSDFDPDYVQLVLITIFCVGASFLNQRQMLLYYLLCLILVGYTLSSNADAEHATLFFGVLIALIVSYVSFMTLLAVFNDLRESKNALAKRTKEFEELSAAVQTLFLPNLTYVKERGFELAGHYQPATSCGGDWWSFSVVPEESVSIFVGDITGHGPGSAMMTASVASYLKAFNNKKEARAVPEILTELNSYLLELQSHQDSKDRYLMTMVAIEVNLRTRELNQWSAGAPFPFLLKASGETIPLGTGGNPLGLSPSLVLNHETVRLDAGDRIFIYTDGITEMRIAADRQMGERRLTKLLKSTSESAPKDAIRMIETDLLKQKFGPDQEDDFTYVVLDVS